MARNIPEGWCAAGEASRLTGVHISAINDVVVKYDVPHRKCEGIIIYHVDSLKIAAQEVHAMRAARKDKRYKANAPTQEQGETANA